MPGSDKQPCAKAIGLGWPRSCRLTRSADIRQTIQRGQRFPGGYFRFFFWPTPESAPRFAISVRKKVGTACARNREKRQLREAIRNSRPHWPEQGWGVFVIDFPAPREVKVKQRQEVIDKLLHRLGRRAPRKQDEAD